MLGCSSTSGVALRRQKQEQPRPDSPRPLSAREPLIDEAAFKTPKATPVRPKKQPE